MKKTSLFVISLVMLLLMSAAGLMLANSASANDGIFVRHYLPELVIKSDGTITGRQVTPQEMEFQAPEFIIWTGNVYTLTADIEGYGVIIECDNIVFDGAGHNINASAGFENAGLRLLGINNVNVKNLKISGDYSTNIYIGGSSNCTIKNVKTEGELHLNSGDSNNVVEADLGKLGILFAQNNIFSKCTISRLYLAHSSSNLFFQNNFLFEDSSDDFRMSDSANFWDNGSVGNYWSDYMERYPNASEIGNTGIGDTPYMLDNGNIDHYPLMFPYNIEKNQITLPERSSQTDTGITSVLAVGISIVSVIGAVAGLIYRQKKHKI